MFSSRELSKLFRERPLCEVRENARRWRAWADRIGTAEALLLGRRRRRRDAGDRGGPQAATDRRGWEVRNENN